MKAMETLQRTEVEEVQEEATAPEIQVERDPDVSGAEQLQAELDSTADSMNVRGFKCAHESCGLVHGHSTNKHRAGDSFDMSDSEAADMEANPNCHCGLNELARRGIASKSPSQANRSAPIPDEMSRHLESSL
jgi:uncharacterized cupin superfamily protein